jgi:hypothetical protein
MQVIAVLICGALALLLGVSHPAAGTLLSREVRSEDWDITDWSSIRLGQLGVTHGPSADELQIYALARDPRPVVSGRIQGASPSCKSNCYLVSSFDSGNQNSLGGYFNVFQAFPSWARTALRDWDDRYRALTLDYLKTGVGYCGMWIHLYDFKQPAGSRIYLDASPYEVLTFWVRGRQGNERLLLKISDALWDRKEDALPLGDVGGFLPNGRIESTWRRAVIPLSALPRDLDRRHLAGLIFEVTTPGEGRIGVKDLAFCKNREPLSGQSPPHSSPVAQPDGAKALWVWNTAEIMGSAGPRQELAEFCRREGFTDLFLQLPNGRDRMGQDGEITLDATRWKGFLTFLANNRLRAHALDGFKNYALPEWHERVLKTVDNVVRYNESAGPDERFSGIHYDIEPYLLPGFQGPRQQKVLVRYLELLEKMALRARAAKLSFGVDIPFWYDSPNELTGELFPVEFHKVRKPASEHVLDLVDHAAVMDYRTFAYGADGIVALAEGELAYADKVGKKVFIGLETTELPDEDLVEFEGEPGRGLPDQQPASTCIVLEPTPQGATLWLVSPARWEDLRSGFQKRGVNPGSVSWWPVRRVVAVPGSKLSYARLGEGRLFESMLEARDELSRHSSFAGYAIHDYLGYSALRSASGATIR